MSDTDMDCGPSDAEKLRAAVAALDTLEGIHMHIADAKDVARVRAYLASRTENVETP